MSKWLAVVVVIAAACSKDDRRCDRYVDLELKCDGTVTAAMREKVRSTAAELCRMALERHGEDASGQAGELARTQNAILREHIKCADTVKTCDELRRCKEAALLSVLDKR